MTLCAIFLRTGTTPILAKTLREYMGKCQSFMWVPINSENRSGSCSENCGFRIAEVVRGHSEKGISYSENGISNSESCSYTPQLSESSENGLFTPRAFFLKLGWSPGFGHIGRVVVRMRACFQGRVFWIPELVFKSSRGTRNDQSSLVSQVCSMHASVSVS